MRVTSEDHGFDAASALEGDKYLNITIPNDGSRVSHRFGDNEEDLRVARNAPAELGPSAPSGAREIRTAEREHLPSLDRKRCRCRTRDRQRSRSREDRFRDRSGERQKDRYGDRSRCTDCEHSGRCGRTGRRDREVGIPATRTQVLHYLDSMDRVYAAATGRRWADTFANVWLEIEGREIETATSVLMKTRRQYRHLRLNGVQLLDYDCLFWAVIGETLRELELNACQWSPGSFYGILRECPRLESLKIGAPSGTSIPMKNFELPEDIGHEEIGNCFARLRHLELDFRLTEGILDLLLKVLPNVSSLSLLMPGRNADFIRQLLGCRRAHGKITRLDNSRISPMNDVDMIVLLEVCSGSLQELRLDCSLLRSAGFDALGEFTELRHLTLEQVTDKFHDRHLKDLLMKLPNLEALSIDGNGCLSRKGFSEIPRLQKLKRLRLQCNVAPIDDSIRVMVDFGKLRTLQELDLAHSRVNTRMMRSLACLTDLRALSLPHARIDPGCLEIICDSFTKLEELLVGLSETVSDLEGAKLSRLESLRSLRLVEAVGLTDRAFDHGVGSFTMETLVLCSCSLTDAGLASIAAHHGFLKKLALVACRNITGAGSAAVLRSEPLLQTLHISSCGPVGDDFLEASKELCPKLRALRLDNSLTSAHARERFQTERPSVEIESW